MCLNLLYFNCTCQVGPAWGYQLPRVQLGPPTWLEHRGQPHPPSMLARKTMVMASRKERWREGPGQAQVGRARVHVFYGLEVGSKIS